MALLSLYETRYSTWTVSHFYDQYRQHHRGERSYTGLPCLGRYGRRGAHRGARASRWWALLHQEPMSG